MRKFILVTLLCVFNVCAVWPPEGGITEEDEQTVQTLLNWFSEGELGLPGDIDNPEGNLKKYADMGHPALALYHGEYIFYQKENPDLKEASKYVFQSAKEGHPDAVSLIESVLDKPYNEGLKEEFEKKWPVYYSETILMLANGSNIVPVDKIALALLTMTQKQEEQEAEMTPLSLQKTLYFAQACWLQAREQPLFLEERFEAWSYGPVIRSVYQDYKHHKSNPIKIREADYFSFEEENPDLHHFLSCVWTITQRYSAFWLTQITHLKGAPWELVYEEDENNEIPLYWMMRDKAGIIQEIKREFMGGELAPKKAKE